MTNNIHANLCQVGGCSKFHCTGRRHRLVPINIKTSEERTTCLLVTTTLLIKRFRCICLMLRSTALNCDLIPFGVEWGRQHLQNLPQTQHNSCNFHNHSLLRTTLYYTIQYSCDDTRKWAFGFTFHSQCYCASHPWQQSYTSWTLISLLQTPEP